jgi:hypothetical protein
MPIELWVVAGTLTLFAGIAVPVITRSIHVPRELAIETVPDEGLTDRQRIHFQTLDAALSVLGYRPLVNFQVTNLQGANLTRIYRGDHDAAILGASLMKGHSALPGAQEAGQNYLEWITKYEDDTTLTTRNVTVSDLFERMPHQIRQDFPAVSDVVRLKAHHDRRAQELLPCGPRFPHGRDWMADYRDYHRRWCAFQESKGLLRHDTEAGVYRATARTAWRGIANFLNPLADNFTPARFVLGLLLGAGVPALGILAAADLAVLAWLTRTTGLAPGLGRLLVLGAAFTAGGAAVGWLFMWKSFIWALLLGYVPLRLLAPGAGGGVMVVLWMGFVADRVAALRQKRELLV